MTTFRELFAQTYLAPEEISVEASVPLEVAYRLRAGGQASEREVRRVLRVVNSRLEKPASLGDLPASALLHGKCYRLVTFPMAEHPNLSSSSRLPTFALALSG